MDFKLCIFACCMGILLVLWQSEAAPAESLQDREQLRRTLYRLDRVLDELIRRTEDSHTTYKRNEDGSIPYKRNEDGSLPYKRNEDGSMPYKRNEDGNIPYRELQALYAQKRNEDGSLPYKRSEGGDNDGMRSDYRAIGRALSQKRDQQGEVAGPSSSDRYSENNLRKVLRYLADMEDKLQKRDHVY